MVNKKAALVRRLFLSPYPHAHGGLFRVHPLPEFSGIFRPSNMIENEKSIAYSRTVKAFYLFRSRSSLCCNSRRVSLQKGTNMLVKSRNSLSRYQRNGFSWTAIPQNRPRSTKISFEVSA